MPDADRSADLTHDLQARIVPRIIYSLSIHAFLVVLMKQELMESVVNLLSGHRDGLSASAIRRGLKRRVSQPTLWRHLDQLQTRGLVIAEGRGRATRYHAVQRRDVSALRSRRLHESVAGRLRHDPRLLEMARERLAVLRQVNPHGEIYHDRWQELIDGPLPQLLRMLVEDSETADALRKESPFSALVLPADRRRILEALHAA